MSGSVAAVLFDMDGTLVDTERLWWVAVAAVADELGGPLTTQDAPAVVGRPSSHTAGHLLATRSRGRAGVPLPGPEVLAARLDDVFTQLVANEIVPRPGVVALLAELAAAGVPTAIVTASPRRVVDLVRDRLGRQLFTLTVAVEDTERSKPAPDPYLEAAARLGVAPGDCVVIEDSVVGVTAAQAAGCFVLAVPTTEPIEPAPRRHVVASLEQVDLALLRNLPTVGEGSLR